jgi:CSLREA domain-containing protein
MNAQRRQVLAPASLVPLALAAIAACTDHNSVVAPPLTAVPRLSQVASDPVVNSLADPGDGTCDDVECTLREAIAFSDDGGTITFSPALTSGGPQSITLNPGNGQLTIAKNLTLTGPGATLLTVRRAPNAGTDFRIIEIQSSPTGGSSVTIAGLTISGGAHAHGGGIGDEGFNNLTLTRSVVSGNTALGANGRGGGIYAGGGLWIDQSAIMSNHAPGASAQGGGVWAANGAFVTLSTIANNDAGDKGGGMFVAAGGVRAVFATLTGNRATTGGAIAKEANQTFLFQNLTIAGNTATTSGGIYNLTGTETIYIENSILANNAGGNCSGDLTSQGDILVYPAASACGGITPDKTGDPKLGPLALNAPGTTPTMALLAGSAAIDAQMISYCYPTDQRGVARPQGVRCDIGAYERELPSYVFTGFFQPVDNQPTLNTVKAGSSIPVKFGLGGNQGLDVLAPNSPASQQIACDTSAPLDDIETTVTAGGSSLSYDAAAQLYVYVWKTEKSWAGTCRMLTVTLADGTTHSANFKLK